jgi:hypothetical protein
MKNIKSNTELKVVDILMSTKWYQKNKALPYYHSEWISSLFEQVHPMFDTWNDYIEFTKLRKEEIEKAINDIRLEIFKF